MAKSFYATPGVCYLPPRNTTFICDVCELPGTKESPNQVRHGGECRRKAQAKRDAKGNARKRKLRRLM